MKEEFYFCSSDGVTPIHAVRWSPEGEVRAVLQIVHGMCEHIERYDDFARFLAKRGVLVVGHSHLGHGKSVKSEELLGYYTEKEGNDCLIEDIHALRNKTQQEYLYAPYYLLGHSMGSFLTRQYLGVHGEHLDGAVIMGTADLPQPVLLAGMALCRILALFKGWYHRSALVSSMVTDGYKKKYGLAWLSKNAESNAAYEADPRCGFRFTLNAFYNLFLGLYRTNRQERAGQIPMDYPILFVSGYEDPVGNMGKGVKTLYERYKAAGAQAECRLYEGDRHEILNELDRAKVYDDIFSWMYLL